MQDKKKKIVVLCSRPPQNVKLQLSSDQVSDRKEMYIEAGCTCQVVAFLKPIAFFAVARHEAVVELFN